MQPQPPGQMVSPPTRGWTRSGEALLLRELGFPAHAGMDPTWQTAMFS